MGSIIMHLTEKGKSLELKQWKINRAVETIMAGKLSLWEASEEAEVTIPELIQVLEEREVDWVATMPLKMKDAMKRIKGSR